MGLHNRGVAALEQAPSSALSSEEAFLRVDEHWSGTFLEPPDGPHTQHSEILLAAVQPVGIVGLWSRLALLVVQG